MSIPSLEGCTPCVQLGSMLSRIGVLALRGPPCRPHSFLPHRPPRGHPIPSEASTLSSDKKYYDLTTCGFRRFGSAVILQIKCREWVITFWIWGVRLNRNHYYTLIKIPLIIKIIFWCFNNSRRGMEIKHRDRPSGWVLRQTLQILDQLGTPLSWIRIFK